MKTCFLLAGEASGDCHGAELAKQLQQRWPNSTLEGVAGPQMRAAGVNALWPMEEFQVMGFSQVAKRLLPLTKQFFKIRKHILRTAPDRVIFIDYPGFNLRMAESLRRRGYKGKLIQYVCPAVWAWGKGRIGRMAASLDLLLTIFPFEASYFAHSSLPTYFVGHPLAEQIKVDLKEQNPEPLLGIFPGSRPSEITLLLERQLQAARLFRQRYPEAQVAISVASEALRPLIQERLAKSRLQATLVPGELRHQLMQRCRAAIASSGTVTLELALHHVPTVVVYDVSAINRWIVQKVLRPSVSHVCIVNIICGHTVFPELVQKPFTAKELSETLRPLWEESVARQHCVEGCWKAAQALESHQSESASSQIVAAIEQFT